MMKLLMATSNKGKLGEVRALLAPHGIEVLGLADLDVEVTIVEDADTFEGNAKKKALALHEATGLAVLADDSGLVVEALDGAPGVYSARFAGPGCSDRDNNLLLLEKLDGVTDRNAAFICAMVLIDRRGAVKVTEGRFEGMIATEERGNGGFGYDPVFIPEEWTRTLAEASLEEKNRISHRALALKAILPALIDLSKKAGQDR